MCSFNIQFKILDLFMKKILITGGSGFLGKNLAKKLKNHFTVVISSRNHEKLIEAADYCGCKYTTIDITNINSVRDVFNEIRPNYVIHAAASKYVDISENNPNETIDTNVLGSQNIARVSIENKVSAVIGISTDKVAQPIYNIYALSKSIMERLFYGLSNKSKTNFVSVRFGNIAWSTGSIFPLWKKMVEKHKKILSTSPESTRFFISIDEAINLVTTALTNHKKLNGKIITKEMKSTKILNLLDAWCKKYKVKWKKINHRRGDSSYENIIGINELKSSSFITIKNKKYILIDFAKNNLRIFRDTINSNNCKKLNNKEINKLSNF